MLRPETDREAAFRAEVRAWLAANVPDDLRHTTFRPSRDRALAWYRALSARGLVAPHWPESCGGMGATPVEQVILLDEMARAGAPDFPTQGLNQIGPLLMACASDAQKARHLPPILHGDVVWCQGYSEPGAGSDLASLRTRAERRGDTLVIDGQKIWTTWGHHADWMFALVRTSMGARNRDGITFVLIDLTTDGIRRRPITTIAGDDEFAEVFFDGVVVPLDNVVGDIDRGWQVATAVLVAERLRIGSPAHAFKALERLRMMARSIAADAPIGAAAAERIALAEIEVEALVAAFLQASEAAEAGMPTDSSYLKVLATETTQRLLDVTGELAGRSAGLRDPVRAGPDLIDYTEMFLQSRRLSIYAGSNEIQRNLIATRVLGLPNR